MPDSPKPRSPKRKAALAEGGGRFFGLLHHLGWSLATLGPARPIGTGKSAAARTLWQAAPLPDGQALLILQSPEGIPAIEDPYRRYEDFAPAHRALQLAIAEAGIVARHAVLVDDALGAQLIDLVQEEVLLSASGTDDIVAKLLPLLELQALARGSLAAYPRKSARSRARELADWTRVWGAKLGAAAHTSRDAIGTFFNWMHLARLAEHLGIGPERRQGFAAYGAGGKEAQPVRFLTQAFVPLSETWNLLQGVPVSAQKHIASAAHEAQLLSACLASYALLSGSKFSAEIFAEAFADEELRHIGWRTSVIAQPEPRDAERVLAEAVEVDLDSCGYPGLLRQFDEIAEAIRILAREHAVQRERGERPGLQLDLLGAEPPPLQEEDAPRVALQSSLKVRTRRRDRAETARLVLLAHAAEWHARLRRPDPIFPAPQITLTEQPRPVDPLKKPRNAALN